MMASRSTGLAEDGSTALDATVGGMQWGFAVGAVLAVGVLVVAIFMPGRVPGATGHGPAPIDEGELDAVA